jgi:hypothetical protein
VESEGPYPEPLSQAAVGAGQKSAELFFVAAMLLQVAAQIRANRALKAADDLARQDADMAAARTRWARARNPKWLDNASLRDVAGAWGAAAPYEEADAGAAVAMDACEARLRVLHPPAMKEYDALRRSGLSRVEAMKRVAPEFLRHPSPRPGPRNASDVRLPLPAGDGGEVWVLPGPRERAAAHLLEFIRDLDEASVAAGEGPLAPEVIEVALQNRTNADPALIRQIVEGRREGARLVPPAAPPARPQTVASAGVAAADWPLTARDGVSAAALRQAAGGRLGAASRYSRPQAAQGRAPRLHP